MTAVRIVFIVLTLGLIYTLAPGAAAQCEDMPSGRLVGSLNYSFDYIWQELDNFEDVSSLDFLVVNRHSSWVGMPEAVREVNPEFKLLLYASYTWVLDFHAGELPGSRPAQQPGRAMYDAFYPDDIAIITPVNPDPAVADTAFVAYAGDVQYVIDIDNPGVAEELAEIVYNSIIGTPGLTFDGVFLDGVRVPRNGYAMYGCDEGDPGYVEGDDCPYWVDFDRDGIPMKYDPDEAEAVTAAVIRMTDRLRELGGECFLVAGNGWDHLADDYEDSEGRLLSSAFEIRFREHFPSYWAGSDQWLYPWGIGEDWAWNHGSDTVWDWASFGPGHDWIPTPSGGYLMFDTMSTINAPWMCVASMMVDGAVAMVGQSEFGTNRRDGSGGDPMPLMNSLGAPDGPAVVDGITISRQFAHGHVVMEVSNDPAEDVVPVGAGAVVNPAGPFKFWVLGEAPGDTIYHSRQFVAGNMEILPPGKPISLD